MTQLRNQRTTLRSPNGGMSAVYLALPVAGMLSGLAGALMLPPFSSTEGWWWVGALPFWLGLLCAPGYVVAWWKICFQQCPACSLPRWLEASVIGAFVTSFAAVIPMLATGLLWLFPLAAGLAARRMLEAPKALTHAHGG